MLKYINSRTITIAIVVSVLVCLSADVMKTEAKCLDNGNSVAMCTGRG